MGMEALKPAKSTVMPSLNAVLASILSKILLLYCPGSASVWAVLIETLPALATPLRPSLAGGRGRRKYCLTSCFNQ